MAQTGTVPVVTQQPGREVRVRGTGGVGEAAGLRDLLPQPLCPPPPGVSVVEESLGLRTRVHSAVSSTQEMEGDILTSQVRDEIIT